MIEALAWTGAALSTLLGLPQAVRTLRTNRLEALSAATYWLTLANALVWAAWAILTGHLAAGVPALVNGPAAVLILTRLEAARRACAVALGLGAAVASTGQPTEPAVPGGVAPG
jgi:uncharacterized protein with PQ loop repeat